MKYIMQDLSKKNSFTFIRLVCCLLVIFDHTWLVSGENKQWITGLGGRMSIYVFFILSGFWVTQSLLRSKSVKEYALKRFRKIFPSYWIVVLVCSVGFVFFSSLNTYDYFFNKQFARYLLSNLFTLNFLCPNLPGGGTVPFGINGSLWTIKVEIGFYVSLPIILLISKKISEKKFCCNMELKNFKKINLLYSRGGTNCSVLNLLCLILYALSILCLLIMLHLISKYGFPNSFDNQLPSLFCYFSAGMLCLFNLEFVVRNGRFFIIPCIAICVLHFVFDWVFLLPFFPMALAVSVIFVGFRIPVFSKMKDFSYEMYLTHFPIINALSFTNVFKMYPVFGLLSVMGLSFACAYILKAITSIKIKCDKKSISEAPSC